MLSPTQQKLAVRMVGETRHTPGLLLASVVDLASKYDGLDAQLPDGLVGVSLEDLHVQRDLVKIALADCRHLVQKEIPLELQVWYQQEPDRLQKMLAALEAEIARVLGLGQTAGGVAVGLLATTVPDPLPKGVYDISNSPRLRGDAHPWRRGLCRW